MKERTLNKKLILILMIIFITIQLAIYLIYHIGNIPFHIEYISIILSFPFSLLILFLMGKENRKRNILLSIILFFAIVADLFLVILDFQDGIRLSLGVGFFILLQAFAFWLLIDHISTPKKKLFCLTNVIARAFIFITLLIIYLIVAKTNTNLASNKVLIILTLFYITNLATNLISSIFIIKQNPLIFVGLLLLLACDIFVGLGFLDINIIAGINVAWIFYIPSNTILAISSTLNKVDKY